MPELPEVETVRRGLTLLIIAKKIISVSHDTPKSFPNATAQVDQFLIGSAVTGIRRRAKVLLIDLDTDYTLVIHLKMTGQLVFVGQKRGIGAGKWEIGLAPSKAPVRFGAGHPSDSLVGELPDRSTRVVFTFDDGSHLYFNDQRKFGWVKLVESQKVESLKFMQTVGPEPLEPEFTPVIFRDRIRRRANTTVKAALLDQTVLAGIGNIYADESLWGAKIHPETRVAAVSDAKLKKLFTEIQFVLRLAIEKGGSTDRNYVNAEGKKGSYIDFARVFRQEGKACPRCGHEITKTRVAGRGTHLCPYCQRKVVKT